MEDFKKKRIKNVNFENFQKLLVTFLEHDQVKFSQFIDQFMRYLCRIMSPRMTSVNQFLTIPQVGKWIIPSSTPWCDRDMRPLSFLKEI